LTREFIALEARRIDDLLKSEIRRQDDLREMERLHHLELETKRNELIVAEAKRLDANMVAEARRVDAVIASDRAAVLLANTEAKLTAAALAERGETSARTLAAQVESTKNAAEAARAATAEALASRIQPLEDARLEAAGGKANQVEGRDRFRWTTGMIITTLLGLVALLFGAVEFILKIKPPG
jgi:4-hydroxyphenylpyruvate dioxygenase-like putative hemolysin